MMVSFYNSTAKRRSGEKPRNQGDKGSAQDYESPLEGPSRGLEPDEVDAGPQRAGITPGVPGHRVVSPVEGGVDRLRHTTSRDVEDRQLDARRAGDAEAEGDLAPGRVALNGQGQLAITARVSISDGLAAEAAGFQAHLAKPFEPSEVASLTALFGHPSHSRF